MGDRQCVDSEHVRRHSLTTLTSFGTPVKTWLAAKANGDWVQ